LSRIVIFDPIVCTLAPNVGTVALGILSRITVAEQFVEENVSPGMPPPAEMAIDFEPSALCVTVTECDPTVTHASLGASVIAVLNVCVDPLIVIENEPVPYVVPVELELFLYDRVAVTVD
jgi:hypothetical protein